MLRKLPQPTSLPSMCFMKLNDSKSPDLALSPILPPPVHDVPFKLTPSNDGSSRQCVPSDADVDNIMFVNAAVTQRH